MDNVTYEFFICRCWDCERSEHGANTDIWEDLCIKHYNFKNSKVGNFIKTKQEFEKKLKKVKDYIDKAFNKLIRKANKKDADLGVIQEITKLKILVQNSSEPQEIFDSIKAVFPVINDNKL